MIEPITGLVAATHTPFADDGSLNLAPVEAQARHMLACGVKTVFVGGSTGESASLTVDERLALAQRWMETVRGSDLRVIVHVGGNCQKDCIALAAQAGRLGARAIGALAPSYFKPARAADVVDFMAPVAGAAGNLPFYYYEIPSMTGLSVPALEVLTLGAARIATLAGAKFTSTDLMQFQEVLAMEGGRMNILFGLDEILLAALALGARGAVGSSYNFGAPIYHRVIAAFEKGDLAAARKHQMRSVQLIRLLCAFNYIPAAKHVMTLLGVPVGPARPPLPRLDDKGKADLERQLKDSGLWDELQPG